MIDEIIKGLTYEEIAELIKKLEKVKIEKLQERIANERGQKV